ncbi:ribonuclease H-like domain-containing protein, partial [Phyllosticta citrichinensis]
SPENIHTNHFQVTLPKTLHRYTIGLTKVCSAWSQGARKRLIEAFFDDVLHFGGQESKFATDYLLNIVSWEELEFSSIDMGLNEEAVDSIRPSTANDRLVLTRKVQFGRNQELVAIYSHGLVDLNSLKDYVQGQPGRQDHDNSIACQSLNIIISKATRATINSVHETFQLGSNRLFIKSRWHPLDKASVSGVGEDSENLVVCHHGLSFVVKPAMGDVLLNVNSATSAFFHPRLVSDFILHHDGTPGFRRLLQGVRVYVNFQRGQKATNKEDYSSRVKTITGFGKALHEETFEKDGKTVSVYDHLVGQYPHQQINRESLSVNLGGKDKAVWYAPEMLRILPYQPYRAKLSPAQTTNMISQACKKPPAKISDILGDGLRTIGLRVSNVPGQGVPNVYGQSSLQIDQHMLTVPSRCVPQPSLVFGGNRTTPVAQGGWKFPKGVNFFSTKNLVPNGFHYLYGSSTFPPSKTAQIIREIHNQFVSVLRQLGIRGSKGPISFSFTAMQGFGDGHFVQGLNEATKQSASLVILLLTQQSTPAYSLFKDKADKRGLQSICFAKYISEYLNDEPWKSLGYFKNVAMKVNLKLGNTNNSVQGGFGTVEGKSMDWDSVMVFGADVTHPSATSSPGTPSIAAVVGSVNGNFGRFPGSMRWQQPDTNTDSPQIIDDIESMVKERLEDYMAEHKGFLPKSIVYYRDGVSEAQRLEVRNREVTAIKAAYLAIARGKGQKTDVPVTAVIVTKRHGTRFFPTKDALRKAGKTYRDNILPGTVVDSCVTSPYYFDFFLASHAGIQGTSKPAHYFVVENGLKFNATELQDFTQRICTIYVRATMTVSYASPAYYADRLCERGRIYLREFYDGFIPADLNQDDFRTKLNNAWNRKENYWHKNLSGTMFWM